MKVYIVIKMEHDDDYKRAKTDHEIVKLYRDKEKAYEFAHKKQLAYMRSENYVADRENERGLPTYTRDENDNSWKVSYGKLIKLFNEVLPEPEFTMMAYQTRYLVKERTLE